MPRCLVVASQPVFMGKKTSDVGGACPINESMNRMEKGSINWERTPEPPRPRNLQRRLKKKSRRSRGEVKRLFVLFLFETISVF